MMSHTSSPVASTTARRAGRRTGNTSVFVRASEKDGKPEPPQLLHALARGRRFVRLHRPAERRERSEMVARRQNNRLHQLDEPGGSRETGKEKAEGRGTKEECGATPTTSPSDKRKKQKRNRPPSPNKSEADDEHESDIHVVTRAFIARMMKATSIRSGPSISGSWRRRAARKKKCSRNKSRPADSTKAIRFGRKMGRKFISPHCTSTSPITICRRPELYSIPGNGGEATKVTTFDMDVARGCRSVRMANRSRLRASTAQPVNSYTQADLWVCDLARDAKPRNLTETFDYDFGSGVFGDCAPPRAGGGAVPLWTPDGKSIVDVYGKEGRTILARFDATTGAATDLTNGNQAVVRFRRHATARKLSTPSRPPRASTTCS